MLIALKNTTYLRVKGDPNKLYLDYAKSAFKILNNCKDNNINSIALVGHNPTLHILSENLTNEKFTEFPTCSIVHISFAVNSWDKIHSGNLEYFLFPNLYRNTN